MNPNGQRFLHSVKLLVVGRFKAGKTNLSCSAAKAYATIDGTSQWLCRPVLIIDADGGTMSIPVELRTAPDVTYIGITTESDWTRAMNEARSGKYKLVIFDSWTNLFDKFAMFARDLKPDAKGRNRDWNNDASDKVAEALEEWSDLAVRPETRGITLISTAAVTDWWAGEFPNRTVIGERIQVPTRIESRLVGRNTAIWHCTREDPAPFRDERGNLDIARTNVAKRNGKLASRGEPLSEGAEVLMSRYLVFTDPFAEYPYVKSQDGFASEVDAIAWNLNLAEVLARHHALEQAAIANNQPHPIAETA